MNKFLKPFLSLPTPKSEVEAAFQELIKTQKKVSLDTIFLLMSDYIIDHETPNDFSLSLSKLPFSNEICKLISDYDKAGYLSLKPSLNPFSSALSIKYLGREKSESFHFQMLASKDNRQAKVKEVKSKLKENAEGYALGWAKIVK